MAVNPAQLLLSLDLSPRKIHVAILDAKAHLTVIASHTIPLQQEYSHGLQHEHPFRRTPYDSQMNTNSSKFPPIAIEEYIQAIDEALEWLHHARLPLSPRERAVPMASKIVAISITATPNLRVLTSPSADENLQNLSAHRPLRGQLVGPSFLAHPLLLSDLVTPTSHDLCQLEERLANSAGVQIIGAAGTAISPSYEDKFSPPSLVSRAKFKQSLARRLGGPIEVDSFPSQVAAALSVPRRNNGPSNWRQQNAAEAMVQAGRILELGHLVACIFVGKISGPSLIEASMSGFFDVEKEEWDNSLLSVTTESASSHQTTVTEGGFASTLGQVQQDEPNSPLGQVSPWIADRFGFHKSCAVMSPLPRHLASYISFLPGHGDFGIQFGLDDYALVPTTSRVMIEEALTLPNPLANLMPSHPRISMFPDRPRQLPKQNFIVIIRKPAAGKARKLIRDTYTNGNWDAFQRLIGAVCPGGSIGMDNKFYSVCSSQGDSQDIRRFEIGQRVDEFSDLRANARCLIEGQALSMRSVLSRISSLDQESMLSSGDADEVGVPSVSSNVDFAAGYRGPGSALGFNPYDSALSPARLLAWGKAAQNRSIEECCTNIIGGVWTVEKEFTRRSEGHSAHCQEMKSYRASRAALGAAYFALASVEACSSKQNGHDFPGFHDLILSRFKGQGSSRPVTSSGTPYPTPSRSLETLEKANDLALVTTPPPLVEQQRVPVSGRARSSSSPVTAFTDLSTPSRNSTLSSGSSASSPFAIDTASLILSPSLASYLSSPVTIGTGPAKGGCGRSPLTSVPLKVPSGLSSRPRTSSTLPAPLQQTLLGVVVEGEEALPTPQPATEESHFEDRRSSSGQGTKSRPTSLLGRMPSAPNFSSSLAMTNVFQPVGTAASGRSRASSSASSWGEVPNQDGQETLAKSSSGPSRVQWSDSMGPSRSSSFSSTFSPDAKPFVSTFSPGSSTSAVSVSGNRPGTRTLSGQMTSGISAAPLTPLTPVGDSGGLTRSWSASLSTSQEALSERGEKVDTAASGGGGSNITRAGEGQEATSGRSRISATTIHRTSSRESHAETLQEKAMRAWLQGQSSRPPSLHDGGGSGCLSSSQHEQDGIDRMRGEEGGMGGGPLDDPSPLRSQNLLWAEEERRKATIGRDWQQRLDEVDCWKREVEKVLGLERCSVVDWDIWAVYGAFLEEYVRLKDAVL